ncbi:Plasmodium exported protein, unknown function [Plasmodium vinckei vinckei]|uniref:Fam-b protein n=1 Tax=Plasmodium vinckei vinckei TaxID=54757 RepID=A0A449BZ85_PLAVN|nr:Plasmodium exported protein, unknown function [Plasmodium vinckei vinckei]KEG04423.1 hypothetical protein YYE_01329 [Plasmodium vinckei vinckei]VEV58775.1 Plasmodium exported protein, unknown function [Plasmodium vinckei vinckei]
MNSVFSIKSFIFALIVCCQYYQNESNKSEHIFKGHDATITLSSRINRLLTEREAPPTTNPLSSHRRKEKEFNTESQKGDLEININENDIVNLENYIEENINNNNMNDDDDDDETEVEDKRYSSNCQTYSKRDCLTGDHKKNPKYFLGINKKKMKKYVTNMNMQAGFVGPTAFGVSYPIHQALSNNMFAPADALNYWLTGSSFVFVFHLIRIAFFNTRKVNI